LSFGLQSNNVGARADRTEVENCGARRSANETSHSDFASIDEKMDSYVGAEPGAANKLSLQ
jgi:hypothetical protein